MAKNLYVGNLSYEVTEETLKKSFEEIGECISVNIITDKFSGQSKGFGFVEMAREEDAQEAIKKLNGTELGSRKLTVNEARPRRDRDSSRRSGGGPRGRGRY